MADQNNPWDTTPAADSAAQSADAWGTPTTAPTDGGGADWLTSTPAPNVEHFNILDPFHKTLIPLDSWVTEGIDWVVTHLINVQIGQRYSSSRVQIIASNSAPRTSSTNGRGQKKESVI